MNIVFRNALFVQVYFCRIELPHYNYLKMLRTAIPFALSLAFPPVFHTLHFISGCPILSTAMEDELQITLTNDYILNEGLSQKLQFLDSFLRFRCDV